MFMKADLLAAVLCLSAISIAQTPPPLAITETSLPNLDAGIEFRVPLHATGGVPPYHWTIAAGDLPSGTVFTVDGVFSGRPTKPGTFAITVAVTDSDRPAHSISRDFRSQVTASLLLEWLRPPAIHGSQIDGAVQVSNGSQDMFDLTVFIVAVNDIGRATSLRYQHFNLGPGTTDIPISFTETLPPGAYAVHADAIAEIPAKSTILRQRLQTASPLPVTQGPKQFLPCSPVPSVVITLRRFRENLRSITLRLLCHPQASLAPSSHCSPPPAQLRLESGLCAEAPCDPIFWPVSHSYFF